MPIKMIVSDLDRTLLQTDKSISAYTADILHACQHNGIKVAFATARSENSCKRYAEMVCPDAVISNGGAIVRAGDSVVYRAAMSEEISHALLESCLQSPNVGYITVDTDKGYFVNHPVDENDPNWIEYLPACQTDFSRGLDCEAYKITVEISDGTTANAIAAMFPSVAVIQFSGENWYRFADKEADKWHGVKALAAYYGIDVKKVAAFGDDYNDIDMLRACGTGVAVSNAIDEVKAAADYVCDSNDNDGVAKWLEERVL